MSADMIVFNNPEFGEIRRVELDGEYWLVGVDVAKALGYANPIGAVKKRVDTDDCSKQAVIDIYGRTQNATCINESGVYSLIFASKLPNAKQFKKWVTSEVLPSIRKTGTYTAPAAPVPAPMSPAQLIAAQAQILVDMEAKMQAMQDQTAAMQNQYDQLAQKVDTAVKVMARPSEDHWKADMDAAIKELCEERRWSVFSIKGKMYRDLELKINCDINSRLTRLRNRKKKAGARRQDVMALNKLDAIAADKQLRAAFELVVKEWQARSVTLAGQCQIIEQETFEIID